MQVCTSRPINEVFEAAVNALLHLGEVAVAVLGEVEIIVYCGDRGLRVVDKDSDPTQRFELGGVEL